MKTFIRIGATAGAAVLAVALPTLPAQASIDRGQPSQTCLEPGSDAGSAAARGVGRTYGPDHRDVTAKEQRRIDRRTDRILDRRGVSDAEAAAAGGTIPVYVHVMAGANGAGDVSDAQIDAQIDVLNATYSGGESPEAADTGFTFSLAGVDRYYNRTWHLDHASAKYRKATRQGGADALNIWLVDFRYLGIATFPWDYAKKPGVDGIRVHWDSLPGGSIENFNFGETATHEAGHWLGLYHTFQGGCNPTNDEVEDTPAQQSPSSGCPEGNDTCPAPGLDPVHNYMDYSFDTCYNQFTPGQSDRMSTMWTAYRG